MRTFSDIEKELGLRRFLPSERGTLYHVPAAVGAPRLLVRKFDGELPPSLVQPYAEITCAAQRWIERDQKLDRLVRIDQPIEIGTDFIARIHKTYNTSTRSYAESDDVPETPPELEEMKDQFRFTIGKSTDRSDTIVERVLARSLLEVTDKTYFSDSEKDPDEGQFVVADLKITREDLEEWLVINRAI